MMRGAITLVAGALAGCAVGPDYQAPVDDTGEFMAQSAAQTNAVVEKWWETLADPTLNALIDAALADSPDLAVAAARLDQARAVRGVARAAFWPALAATGSYTNFEQSLESPGAFGQLVRAGLAERDGEFYTQAFETSWEIDAFGRVRRSNEQAAATLGVAIADYQAAVLGIVAETAAAYFEYLGANARLVALERNIALQRETLTLIENKQRVGLARRIDALRADAELNALVAQREPLKAGRDASLFRLGVLTRQRPEQMTLDTAQAAMPALPANVAVGTRAALLRRRPDVQAAERQLAAATAAVGVATADFFPRLTLAANFGFEAVSFDDIGTSDARLVGIVPQFRLPLFEGRRLRAALEAAGAEADAAHAGYEATVLTAIAEAETALRRYAAATAQSASLDLAATAAGEAALTARRLYNSGLIAFLDVLDAERRQAELDDQAAGARAGALLAITDLYRSLGGGWQHAAPE